MDMSDDDFRLPPDEVARVREEVEADLAELTAIVAKQFPELPPEERARLVGSASAFANQLAGALVECPRYQHDVFGDAISRENNIPPKWASVGAVIAKVLCRRYDGAVDYADRKRADAHA